VVSKLLRVGICFSTERTGREIRMVEADSATKEKAPRVRLAGLELFFLLSVVGLLRFRLWPFGFLEEYSLSTAYQAHGYRAYFDSLEFFSSRPLSLVPAYSGLAIAGGRMAGQYLVAAGIGILQFLLLTRCTKHFLSRSVAMIASLLFVLNPFWEGGYLLRYQPAQLSLVFLLGWLALRQAHVERAGWGTLLGSGVAIIGLHLSYPALVFVPLVVVVTEAYEQRNDTAKRSLVVTFAATGLALVYVRIIAPALFATYEAAASLPKFRELPKVVSDLYSSVLTWPGLALLAGVVVGVIACGRPLQISWLRQLALLAAPLCATPYAAFRLHLGDPDRISFPISVAVLVLLLPLLSGIKTGRRTAAWAALAITAVSYFHVANWRSIGRDNETVIRAVRKFAQLHPGQQVLVVDHTGYLGDVYRLLPPVLSEAVNLLEANVDVEICTSSVVDRRHPVSLRYPIPTTKRCPSAPGASASASEVVAWRGGNIELLSFPSPARPKLV
jgi:hypothetical protein